MKKTLFLLLALLPTAVSWADMGVISWAETLDIAPYDVNDIEASNYFINIDTVALKTQDMTITFDYPNKVSVCSDYVFEVLAPEQTLLVAYIPDWTFMLNAFISEPGEFFVSVNGKELGKDNIKYPVTNTSDEKNPYAMVFPINFGDHEEYQVNISYWYKLEGDFEKFSKDSEPWGFLYDFSPAMYWAGNVDRITVNLVLNGVKVTELGELSPPDFKFTENGCQWVWEDLDKELEGLALSVYYGNSRRFDNEFSNVISDVGVNVRSGPGIDYPIIATLPKGERLYVQENFSEELSEDFVQGNISEWWLKCRLLDNREGYVCAYYNGENLLEIEILEYLEDIIEPKPQ